MATTATNITKVPLMASPSTWGINPNISRFATNFPSSTSGVPGASFYPPMGPTKFPPTAGGMTTEPSTGFMPGYTPGMTPGFGPEAWNAFESAPWQGFPPFSYRDWPLNVTNTFGPSNVFNPNVNPMMNNPMMGNPWMNINNPMMNPMMNNPMTMPTTTPMMQNMIPGMMNTSQTLANINFRPNNWLEFYSLTNPIRVVDSQGNRMLFLTFDMRGFKPEDINVTLNKTERSITVEANYENKDKEHQVQRRFFRRFILPDYLKNVDLSKVDVNSTLNVNGTLIVEANLPRMTPEEMNRWTSEMHSHVMMPGFGGVGGAGAGFGMGPVGFYGTPGMNFPVSCRPVTA